MVLDDWYSTISFSRESSRPRGQTGVSFIVGGSVTYWATREAPWVSCPHPKQNRDRKMKRERPHQLNLSPFIRKAEALGLDTVKSTVSPHFYPRDSPQWVPGCCYLPLQEPLEVDPAAVWPVLGSAGRAPWVTWPWCWIPCGPFPSWAGAEGLGTAATQSPVS